jgi:hypothetical protein
VVIFVPGPVELRECLGAAAGGEQRTSVGLGADGAQDRTRAAVENLHGLGEDVEVLFAQSAQVEGDAFEAGHAGVTGCVRFGDVEAGGGEGVIAGSGTDLVEQPVPARPQRPVAAALFCTLQDRPQSVACRRQIAAARGDPATHNGDAGVANGLVGFGERIGDPQLGRGDLGLAAQERDCGTDRDRVEKMQIGAQLAAKLDQCASASVGVIKAPEIEVLPHLRAGDAREQSLGGCAAGVSMIEQGLGVVVAVHELQRGDLLGEVRRASEGTQLTKMPQGHLVAPLVTGCLASGLHRQRERFPVATVTGLLDRAGRFFGSWLAG